jgi:hypothetical protein
MRFATRATILRFLALCLALPAAGVRADDRIIFKPAEFAILRLDERPAKTWDVFLAEKKKLVLVRLGARYLLLDTVARDVFEVAPAAIEQKGKELVFTDPKEASAKGAAETERKPSKQRLASEAWNIRDAGPARIIKVKLSQEGHTLEVQLRITPAWVQSN